MQNERLTEQEQLEQEYAQALLKGREYEILFNSPLYGKILDWMEKQADNELASMRQAIGDQGKVNVHATRWSMAEEILHKFQVEVQDAVAERLRILEMVNKQQEMINED